MSCSIPRNVCTSLAGLSIPLDIKPYKLRQFFTFSSSARHTQGSFFMQKVCFYAKLIFFMRVCMQYFN
nr:MAG TPA_asm: hypothetical protein [Bacteriophage sp.]